MLRQSSLGGADGHTSLQFITLAMTGQAARKLFWGQFAFCLRSLSWQAHSFSIHKKQAGESRRKPERRRPFRTSFINPAVAFDTGVPSAAIAAVEGVGGLVDAPFL